MTPEPPVPAASGDDAFVEYLVLGGQRLRLRKHPTDFSVIAPAAAMRAVPLASVTALSRTTSRARTRDPLDRDRQMDTVRASHVAHHVYEVEGTGEEVVIGDRVILTLREGSADLARIADEFHLVPEGRMGSAHVLRVTRATGMNPLKASALIAARPEVVSCSADVLIDQQPQAMPDLHTEQWYLTTSLDHVDVASGAGVNAPAAWGITTGDPGIVLAVIDDGFDLGHPSIAPLRVHEDARDFVDGDAPLPGPQSFHGTMVATIAMGAHHQEAAMRGLAPGCTFLPVRALGVAVSPFDMIEVFRFVSARADVVNCSFGSAPKSFDPHHPDFRAELKKMAETGGRQGRGLVIVVSACNDDAPTFLDAPQNVNGVLFTMPDGNTMKIADIPMGHTVYSGYPLTPGVITVAATSSRKRKAGYSSWGRHVTVSAPSSNTHRIVKYIAPGTDPRRVLFEADYRGLGQVAGCNRQDHGKPFEPIPEAPNYTRTFGGTSGAAPIVAGIAALMLSVNPDLSAAQVRDILVETATRDLDAALDLATDPNLQGLSGAFTNGHSIFFGAGKVDALAAVERARALGRR